MTLLGGGISGRYFMQAAFTMDSTKTTGDD
jgi:hypothetical protein